MPELLDGARSVAGLLEEIREALIGAVYLDRGIREVRRVVKALFGSRIEAAIGKEVPPPIELPEVRPENTRLLRVESGWGRANACHLGAQHSDGDVLHWYDADMLAHREEVEAHARWHHLVDYAVPGGDKRFVDPAGLRGLDATIAPPYKDFRFKNNTGNWILIKGMWGKPNIRFEIWGTNPGWNVQIGQPVITNIVKTSQAEVVEYSAELPASSGKVRVEYAQDGFTSSIHRVVRDSSGNVVDDWYANSRYQPARNRFLIGTGR